MPRGYLQRKGPVIRPKRPWVSHDIASVGGGTLLAGSVTSDKFDPALLQGFHVELGADVGKFFTATPISFSLTGIHSFGGEQWSSATDLALKYGGRIRIRAQAVFRNGDSPVLPGARA